MICKKTSAGIGVMRRIKPFVPVDTLEKVYKSLVQPYFEYCSPLWDNCGKLLTDKLHGKTGESFVFKKSKSKSFKELIKSLTPAHDSSESDHDFDKAFQPLIIDSNMFLGDTW